MNKCMEEGIKPKKPIDKGQWIIHCYWIYSDNQWWNVMKQAISKNILKLKHVFIANRFDISFKWVNIQSGLTIHQTV